MLQAKFIDKFKIIIEDIPVPKPEKGEILVKVKYAGICGSDRIMYRHESFYYAPIVMGHEICGVVASEGEKFKKGDRVIIMPLVYCKKCHFCKTEQYNLCEELAFIGDRSFNGGFAEYIVSDENNVFATPENFSDEDAVLIEPLSVAFHATNLIEPEKAGRVMVFGAGLIGLMAIRILKNKFKVKNITAIDIADNKLKNAEKSGADVIINLKNDDWNKKIYYKNKLDDKPFQSGDYDAVIDFVSTSDSTNIAISNLRKKGKLVSVGLPKGNITINEIPFSAISANELDIKGSYCYDKGDFKEVIKMVADKTVKVRDLISAKYSLKNTTQAFDEWEENYSDWYKVIIEP